jgi:hypothetical protein
MRFTSFHKFLMIAPLSVALGWAQQSSLGEIAKQGKTSKKAKIVLTDDDVLHSSSVPAAAQSGGTSEGSVRDTDKATPDAASDAKPKGSTAQQSKDPKINELRQKVEKLKAAEEMYKGGLKAGQDRLAKATTDFERETAQEIVNNQRHNVQMAEDKRKQAEAELSAQEQANKQ